MHWTSASYYFQLLISCLLFFYVLKSVMSLSDSGSHCGGHERFGFEEHPLVWELLRWSRSSGQYTCGQNVDAVGALFVKISHGNADFCRQNINLYSSPTSAAQLFFICSLSLFWLLFAFLWYTDRCPWPTHLMCTAEGSRIFCRVKKVTRAPEIENRKSQTIRSWLNFNSIVCSHGNIMKKYNLKGAKWS